ncbi:MAG: hypothetical protein JNK58_05140 [Phycisphaerae bacterium]|nr:hypothetical protein [Phycisphaerae bacterium]
MFRSLVLASVVGLSSAVVMGQAGVGAPPNDECSPASPSGFGASPITGAGAWSLDDALGATASPIPPLPGGFTQDVWFKWTATWQGTASVAYLPCNELFNIQVFAGCSCPTAATAPLATSSQANSCATPLFDVACGQCFIIRVSVEGFQPGSVFTITPGQSMACPPPAAQVCDECCAKAPSYTDPSYASLADGRFAVQTHFGQSAYALRAMDLDMPSMCPPGPSGSLPIFWAASSAAIFPPTPVTHWAVSTLGSIFALTFDDMGHLYMGRFNGWGFNAPTGMQGSLAGSRNTSIIRLASGGAFGTSSVLVNLPDPNPALAPGTIDTAPGVGDITFDCASRMLYASHLSDGRIYRVSTSGVIQGWYKHATDTLSTSSNAATPDCGVGCLPTDPCCLARYREFAALGDRVWALKARNGRLYYSTWTQDGGQSAGPNRIWSIGLTPGGDFVAGSRRAELTMPASPSSNFSHPVSDIDFAMDCKMVLAERGMTGPNSFQPHQGRLLEYAPVGSGGWAPTSNYNGASGFVVGSAGPRNSAGGVAIDRSSGGACPAVAGRYWVSADAIILNNSSAPANVYGIQGISLTNPAFNNSICIDFDNVTPSQDKGHQGDVEIPCQKCVEIIDGRILCELGDRVPPATGNYTYTFFFKNQSGRPIQYLWLYPLGGFSPNPIALATPVASGATSGPVNVVIAGPQNPGTYCFRVTFADENIDECCQVEHCIELPDCDCLQFVPLTPRCESNGTFTVSIGFINLGAGPINELFAFPQPPGTASFTISPAALTFGDIQPGGTFGSSFVISGATPGSTVCIRFSAHHDGMECCSEVLCIRLPLCDDGTGEPCPGCPPNPTILVNPSPVDVCAGDDATFSVAADVDPACSAVTCHWRKDQANLIDGPTGHGSVIVGAGTQQLTIMNVKPQDVGAYDNVVAASCGQATSLPAALGVIVIPGDADLDSQIDFADITEVLEHWGLSGPADRWADVDGDGDVDFQDITAVLTHFGESCP